MTTTVECPTRAQGDAVHRYVAGTLAPAEVEAFEIHLLDCEACQGAVREGAAVRAGLRAGPGRRFPVLGWSVPLAAAAALVWLVWPASDPLRRLGRVDAVPTFEGLAVRADPDSAARLADRGMAAYAAGDFGEAARLLGSAAALDPSPAIRFFLGISRLRTGEPDSALAALALALEPPDNPYAGEARFYRAKAWLALGEADSALAQLAAVPAGAAVAPRAAGLADSVREVMAR
jgi:tetratricopeptide (TPR) repeat protein